jgi:hypothetical protein
MAMNGRIVAINDSIHDQVQTLLPWFVVDTLIGEEMEMVNQHLNVCAECQADFAWQSKLKSIAPVSGSMPDVDRAFATLLDRLNPAPQKSDSRRLAKLLNSFRLETRNWMQWTLAAQFLVIAGLVVVLMMPDDMFANYHALGANVVVDSNIAVVFKPDTSEQQLRGILNSVGARIVGGPTVTDAYLLNVPDANIGKALHDLRQERAVVLAETLGSRSKK